MNWCSARSPRARPGLLFDIGGNAPDGIGFIVSARAGAHESACPRLSDVSVAPEINNLAAGCEVCWFYKVLD